MLVECAVTLCRAAAKTTGNAAAASTLDNRILAEDIVFLCMIILSFELNAVFFRFV